LPQTSIGGYATWSQPMQTSWFGKGFVQRSGWIGLQEERRGVAMAQDEGEAVRVCEAVCGGVRAS